MGYRRAGEAAVLLPGEPRLLGAAGSPSHLPPPTKVSMEPWSVPPSHRLGSCGGHLLPSVEWGALQTSGGLAWRCWC